MIDVNFLKLNEDAIIPTFANPEDLCFDFYSIENSVLLHPGYRYAFKTGLAWEPKFIQPELLDTFKIGLIIKPRSGLAYKHGIDVLAGVIDSDYRDEIKIILYNTDNINAYEIKKGERIAQGQIVLTPKININLITEFSDDNDRGGGFGSSGK